MGCALQLSIIVPLALGHVLSSELIRQLVHPEVEVIVSAMEDPPHKDPRLEWIINSEQGRAAQMNYGAKRAKAKHLWFVHADSTIGPDTLPALLRALKTDSQALYYFDLKFSDGPACMRVNEIGVWWRSHLLRVPFGDQGLCLSKENYQALGGYDEAADYGEDHLLVWKARRKGMPIKCAGATIETSAEKYMRHGWLCTTAKHLGMTVKQAFPEAVKLLTRQ